MKHITVIIDDDYSEVVSITAIGTSQNIHSGIINLTVEAKKISDGDVIFLPNLEDKEGRQWVKRY